LARELHHLRNAGPPAAWRSPVAGERPTTCVRACDPGGRRRAKMPVYEFGCLKCGKEFTLVLSIREHERKVATCPRCKSKSVESLVTHCEVITSKKS
jgi:putative FmdB family regulatory protein